MDFEAASWNIITKLEQEFVFSNLYRTASLEHVDVFDREYVRSHEDATRVNVAVHEPVCALPKSADALCSEPCVMAVFYQSAFAFC